MTDRFDGSGLRRRAIIQTTPSPARLLQLFTDGIRQLIRRSGPVPH